MSHLKKNLIIFAVSTLLVFLSSCKNNNSVNDKQLVPPEPDSLEETQVPEPDEEVSQPGSELDPKTDGSTETDARTDQPPASFNDVDSYMKYISSMRDFEPYYKTVFAFELLPDGISSVPLEKVKAMYNDMKSNFDYILVGLQPLSYKGHYDGGTGFVEGYEQYQAENATTGMPNPMNAVWHDWEGNEIITTPLKSVMLGENVYQRFDDSVAEGRNLQDSDFMLADPDDPIHVVLGSEYKGIYEIGDVLSLELVSETMNFQVVGFYKPGVRFSMDLGAQYDVSFDYSIIAPYFMPAYEPVGEAGIFQQAFHIAEMTSGYIPISEPLAEVGDETHERFVNILEEMAVKNGLSGLYKYPFWPVGFVW